DTNIEIVVYRIIQECVNNVIKHSKANKLDISILKDEEGLRVTIEDNGIGFNKANLENPSGIGMRNIQARVDYLKGNLDIDTQPGKGTLIAFFIPTN
ncbi:MAG: sensor histidine kinase, partial [Chitinophagaceae bacterium]|nr:sensor histidine kinase [Chitinophagaceae bacterium]